MQTISKSAAGETKGSSDKPKTEVGAIGVTQLIAVLYIRFQIQHVYHRSIINILVSITKEK